MAGIGTQQFTVPQFIDVEDKVFGPITVRQFIILLIASGLSFIFWKLFDRSLAITFLALIDGFALLLAFMKVRGQQFHYFILNITQTLKKPALRIWRVQYSNKEIAEWAQYKPKKIEIAQPFKRPVSRSRLRELSLSVNTGGVYKPENNFS